MRREYHQKRHKKKPRTILKKTKKTKTKKRKRRRRRRRKWRENDSKMNWLTLEVPKNCTNSRQIKISIL